MNTETIKAMLNWLLGAVMAGGIFTIYSIHLKKEMDDISTAIDTLCAKPDRKPKPPKKKAAFIRLDKGSKPPYKAHEDDAGLDIFTRDETITVRPGESVVIDTGVHLAIPPGMTGFIKSRSGMAMKNGLIADTGVIDSGYTGSIKVRVENHGKEPQTLDPYTRFCQLVILEVGKVYIYEVESLEESKRGSNGFGSTGEK